MAFQEDKSKSRNSTDGSATSEDMAQSYGNGNTRKNEDRSYTSNASPPQNPRYNNSTYKACYNRYKSNETSNEYRNSLYVENNKKLLSSIHITRPYHSR